MEIYSVKALLVIVTFVLAFVTSSRGQNAGDQNAEDTQAGSAGGGVIEVNNDDATTPLSTQAVPTTRGTTLPAWAFTTPYVTQKKQLATTDMPQIISTRMPGGPIEMNTRFIPTEDDGEPPDVSTISSTVGAGVRVGPLHSLGMMCLLAAAIFLPNLAYHDT